MGSLGSDNPSLDAVLGYDPWKFLRLVNPPRDFAYLIFGWCFYEAAMCTSILLEARKKWRSPIFQAITLAIFLNVVATVSGMTGYSSSPQVAGDMFLGPVEFPVVIIVPINMAVARWCYFYAMTTMVLSVFREKHKTYRVIVYIVTALAITSSLCYTICVCRFFVLKYEQYLVYMETKNIGAVMSRIPNVILPSLQPLGITKEIAGSTMVLFTCLTKIPFLLKIFSALNVPFREAVKLMVTTRSIQRIVTSTVWMVVEIFLMSTVGIRDITFAVSAFSVMFQTTALAMLAFQDSAAIIKDHSLASRTGSTVKPRSMITSAHGGGSGVDTSRTR